MRRIIFVLVMILALAAAQNNVTLLHWAGPDGSKPGTFEEWIETHPCTDFSYTLDHIEQGDRAGNIAIFTEQNIAGALTSELNQLTNNLQTEGYTVYSYQMTGGTPETLRTMLQNLYNGNGLDGALFIGNLPIAWFEIADDFNQYGYADFPIDLFFMDLDGTWLDTMSTGNGKYDGHTGNVHPEIFVGRLYPTGLGDDTLLLQNYFRKNNSFRHDTLLLTQRAMVFVDDDWRPYANQWAGDVALLYSDTRLYWDAETTRATIYRRDLDTTRASVLVCAHSWPGGHQFAYNSGGSHDNYYSYEYTNQDPPSNFYNFFACSFSRYTESGNCGGNRAIFNASSGVGSIGSTKTGSMLDFQYFYRPLGQGKTLGEAFKYWFTCIYDSAGMSFDRLCWHYGMTLSADPFLIPLGHNTGIAEHNADKNTNSIFTVQSNPVTKHAQMNFTLKTDQELAISVYDCSGRKLKNITCHLGVGQHSIVLLLDDKSGSELVAGIYVIKVDIDNKIFTRKIVKI
jgi:hypothetical protein